MKNIFKLILFLSILALAGISCGVSNIGNLFATETPTPTSTYTPTPTFTPSPTSTSTPTSTPTATPRPTGVASEEQADGSTLFIDYDNKYQLVLSAEWVIIPFDQDELGALVDVLSKDNPQFEEAAAAFKNLDSNIFRLVALNQNPDYFQNGSAPNVNISAVDNDVLVTMPLSFVTGALEQSFTNNGMKVLTEGVNTLDNPHGVEIEFLEIEHEVSGIKIAQRIIVFQSKQKLVMITLTAPGNFRTEVFESSVSIAASSELFE